MLAHLYDKWKVIISLKPGFSEWTGEKSKNILNPKDTLEGRDKWKLFVVN
jgi:hypothetical protein